MSAQLVVTAERTGSSRTLPGSVLIRIRPVEGRSIERTLVSATETIDVPAGKGEVQAIFSSGEILSQTYSVAEGKPEPINFVVHGSSNPDMAFLSVSRDPSRRPTVRTGARSARRRGMRSGSSGIELDSFRHADVIPPVPFLDVAVIARDQAPDVHIVYDQGSPDGEARVLHIRDTRNVQDFRQQGGSRLALLKLEQRTLPGLVRLCALPGPLGPLRSPFETHVALRTADGDELPDMQVVAADQDLAPVIGFLERGNQRALETMRERLVSWARDAMEEKMSDPIAAAIGMAVLLRLGEQDVVRGWSANLWRWFRGLPDGGALHAAVLLQEPVTDVDAWHKELSDAVLGACAAGVPLLSDSMRHLRSALSALGDAEVSDPAVEIATKWCRRMARAMNPDAVFTTLTLEADDLPLVWGARQ